MAYGSSPYGSDSYSGIHPISAKLISFTLDAHIGTFTQSSLDAYLLKQVLKTATIDAILLKTITPSFNLDSILILRQQIIYTLDGLKQKGFTTQFNIDTRIQKQNILKTFDINSILVHRRELSFILDGFIQKTFSKTFSLDAKCYVRPTWFDNSWKYRKKITLQNNASTATVNLRLRFILHKGTGTDSCFDIYYNNNIKDDFSDVRFTKQDGVTPLNHQLENIVSGDSAMVEVEVDYVPDSTNTTFIYNYYKNDNAVDTSVALTSWQQNIDASDGRTQGDDLTVGGWIATQTPANNHFYDGTHAHSGTLSCYLQTTSVPHSQVWSKTITTASNEFIVEGWFYDNMDFSFDSYGIIAVGGSDIGFEQNIYATQYRFTYPGSGADFPATFGRAPTGISRTLGWHKVRFTMGAGILSLYIDDVEIYSAVNTLSNQSYRIAQDFNNGVWFDDINAVEVNNVVCPTHGSQEQRILGQNIMRTHRVGLRTVNG